MKLQWSSPAKRDLVRLYDFLRDVNPRAAVRIVRSLGAAAQNLLHHPRLGHTCDDYAPREVRSLVSGDYELRYEIVADIVIILRVWHTRENR